MAIYVWEGRTAQGRVVKGDNLEAPDLEAGVTRLREQRIRPSTRRVKEKGQGLDREIKIPGLGEKVTTKDVSLATRQLATMIDAGLPIVQCLDILSQQSDSKLLRKTVTTVKKDVEGGSTLADALRKHPKIFDDLYVNMVEAGEAGGILNTILNRIALFIEKANRLKKKVKGAMIYPCAIVGVAVIVVAVLMVFVIPVFAELYGGMGKALPLPTQICIDISNWFVSYWYVLVIGTVGVFMGVSAYYKTPAGHMQIEGMLLRMMRGDRGWGRDGRLSPSRRQGPGL